MSTNVTPEKSPAEADTAQAVTREQKLAACRRAGHYVTHTACWNCGGEGLTDHDCGEDCCCCLNPEPNVTCDICDGEGGYEICFTCHPEADYDYG